MGVPVLRRQVLHHFGMVGTDKAQIFHEFLLDGKAADTR
jgi:hypothetical protein